MAYRIQVFGELPDQTPVHLYHLTNKNGTEASFTNLGGVWVSMKTADQNGKLEDVVLGYDSVKHYLENPPHFGALVGRSANRIAGGKFTLNGKTYELAVNNGPNNLHSGPDYYEKRIWDAVAEDVKQGTRLTFSLESPDGDQGFPGHARITVSYLLTEDDSVQIDYHVVSDQDTVVNMTNHSYFNLAGHGAGGIEKQKVWINADFFTDINEDLIPTGELLPVKGTPMDFTAMKEIGQDLEAGYRPLRLAGGYDHNWVLNHKPGQLVLAAKAVDEESGRCMEVYTDLPGIQFYTANFLEDDFPGKEGASYGRRSAYCFETQYYPNAVNTPQFPSPVLKAGEEYRTVTIYHFDRV